MSSQSIRKHEPTVSVELVRDAFGENDLNDLCDATESAIEAGGGFGWVDIPPRDTLENYWRGVVTAPMRELFIARLDQTICGTTQIVLPPKNNEAQGHMVTLTTNFVAPWARGHGLAKMLLQDVERKCIHDEFSVINLDVRETMEDAIKLYESLGYQKFGEHPYGVRAKDQTVKSIFYYKVINKDYFG